MKNEYLLRLVKWPVNPSNVNLGWIIGDILNIDQYVVVFRSYPDFAIYIVGSINDNELIFAEALDTLNGVFEIVFKEGVERSGIIQMMTVFLLIIDELIDHG